ncbi:hypothetical protein [Falsiroseomonas selenitidurans]|uniref:Uncharacterized protein n=1 Tax=Falsiroseomonas selenitidurans TaxID=2716335 RepID=A0ABX1E2U2_9PROT|nr:hypothetical protein [Falsiroseomonas selenitidurans]NKC31406.1 hypothetical protein [Falsiroseomonas selenitidurans]
MSVPRLLLALDLALGIQALPALAQPSPPLRVTTDGPAYCRELAARLAALPATPIQRQLAAEGLALCDAGHVRTGIAKLRRALRAAQHRPG